MSAILLVCSSMLYSAQCYGYHQCIDHHHLQFTPVKQHLHQTMHAENAVSQNPYCKIPC